VGMYMQVQCFLSSAEMHDKGELLTSTSLVLGELPCNVVKLGTGLQLLECLFLLRVLFALNLH
jgi:hypothetical protein